MGGDKYADAKNKADSKDTTVTTADITSGPYTSQINNIVVGLYRGKNRTRVNSFSFNGETQALIAVVPDISKSKPEEAIYDFSINKNFILSSVQEDRRERMQILETFGEASLLFFDKKTPVYSFSGYLIAADHVNSSGEEVGSWEVDFKKFWEDTFRGTKLVESKSMAAITWNKNIIWGYPINLAITTNATNPFMASFSFNFVVRKHRFDSTGSKLSSFMDLALNAQQKIRFKTLKEKLVTIEKELRNLQLKYEEETDSEKQKTLREEVNAQKKKAEQTFSDLIKLLQLAVAN